MHGRKAHHACDMSARNATAIDAATLVPVRWSISAPDACRQPMLALATGTALALLLAGCATPADHGTGLPVQTNSSVTLAPGHSARWQDGSALHYLAVTNDSRCPPDVTCVWAGDAELALRWQAADGRQHPLRLHSNPQAGATAASFGAVRITLDALEYAPPVATLRVEHLP